MNAHEFFSRQQLLQCLHAHSGDHRPGGAHQVNFYLILQPFNMTYIAQVDLHQIIICLHKDEIHGLFNQLRFRSELEYLVCFSRGLQKPVKRERFQKIINRNQNGEQRSFQALQKLNAIKPWHLNIQQHQVHQDDAQVQHHA